MNKELELEIQTALMGFLIGCPFSTRLPDCPMQGTDHLSLIDKYQWMLEQPLYKLEEMIIHHQNCSFCQNEQIVGRNVKYYKENITSCAKKKANHIDL